MRPVLNAGLRRRGGGLFLKDARSRSLGKWACPRGFARKSHILDPFASLDDDVARTLALGKNERTRPKDLESKLGSRPEREEGRTSRAWADLELEKDDQEDHEHLPQNVGRTRGQEEAPGLSKWVRRTKGKQSDKALNALGALNQR